MTKLAKIITVVLGVVCALVLGCMAYALIVTKGRTIFPVRVSVHYEPVTVPETRVWVSALERQLSPEQFEEVVKTNHEGRDFALGMFAYNDMTNHVRILVKHGADTSESRMETLSIVGMSNAVLLIRGVVSDLNQSSSNNGAAANVRPASHAQ